MTITIRECRWPGDANSIAGFEAEFVTDRVFRVTVEGLTAALHEMPIDPPIRKRYPLPDIVAELQRMDWAAVAEYEGKVVGFVAVKLERWNRRAVVWHLYVAAHRRGCGIGRQLLESAVSFAATNQARCVWVETQNINWPAIRFYLAVGFRFCGLDTSLYDPASTPIGEVAVFLASELPASD